MALKALRSASSFRMLDDRRYDSIESAISKPDPERVQGALRKYCLYPEVIQASLRARTEYRIVDPDDISPRDREFLIENNLSVDFVLQNRAGSANALLQGPNGRIEAGVAADDFQLDALSRRAMAIVCPYSGRHLESDRSILVADGDPIFYRFESLDMVFLAVGVPGIGYEKLYLYIPRICAIILIRSHAFWHGRDNVDRLRAHMIANWRSVSFYLNSTAHPSVCALVDNSHFGHHLWNDLTSIDKIIERDRTHQIDEIIVQSEPFGPIEAIFPSLVGESIVRCKPKQLAQRIMIQNLFLVRFGGNVISNRVIEGLFRAADNICTVEVKEQAIRMRQECWPILWATVRTGNRTWMSQSEGIAKIANDLYSAFPRLGLIIDGFCTPHDQPAIPVEEQNRIIAEEVACVELVKGILDKAISFRVNVGRPLPESVIFARITDIYFVHNGSLQHKIGWLANCPGLVHSNTSDLNESSGRLRASRARSNPVVPRYLDPATVVDVSGARAKEGDRWNDHLSNYDFDYRLARDELLRMLRSVDLREAH
jgi:hypothetical protein